MIKFRVIVYLLFISVVLISGKPHPLYVSVVEIEQNENEQHLEISCRIFTNDFESVLRKTHSEKIDLLNPGMRQAMNGIVEDYVQKHLRIEANGKLISMEFIGYEQADESIQIYFQTKKLNLIKKIGIRDDILYEYKNEQMSMIHVTVNHTRKSTKLNNPDSTAEFVF